MAATNLADPDSINELAALAAELREAAAQAKNVYKVGKMVLDLPATTAYPGRLAKFELPSTWALLSFKSVAAIMKAAATLRAIEQASLKDNPYQPALVAVLDRLVSVAHELQSNIVNGMRRMDTDTDEMVKLAELAQTLGI